MYILNIRKTYNKVQMTRSRSLFTTKTEENETDSEMLLAPLKSLGAKAKARFRLNAASLCLSVITARCHTPAPGM